MNKHNAGFTMAEMLTVVGIITIITIASFNMVRGNVREARDQKRYQNLDTIEAALYAFYGENGRFPNTGPIGVTSPLPPWWDVCTSDTNDPPNHIVNGGWIPGLAPDFISSIPTDPQGCRPSPGDFNGYIYRSNGTDFKIATDWTAELGELCDQPGDKYYDLQRGDNPPGTSLFCSLSSPGAANW